MYYEEDIMKGTFNHTVRHSHLVFRRFLLGTAILPWDVRDAGMVCLTGTPTYASKSAQMVLANDVFYKVNLCLPLKTRGKAVKGVRTTGKAVKGVRTTGKAVKPSKVGNPPCEYVSPFRNTSRSIRR